MYIIHSQPQQMDGLFSSIGKAVNKVVAAPLKVATKVASKVLPDKVEKAALAIPKAVTNLTTKSITAVAKVPDAVVSPVARAVRKNPAITQAAGAIASVIPGGQPVGAALLTAGRLQQQALARKEAEKAAALQAADLAKMQADMLKAQMQQAPAQNGPTVITVPGASGGSTAPAAPGNYTPLLIGGGVLAAIAVIAMSSNRGRR